MTDLEEKYSKHYYKVYERHQVFKKLGRRQFQTSLTVPQRFRKDFLKKLLLCEQVGSSLVYTISGCTFNNKIDDNPLVISEVGGETW